MPVWLVGSRYGLTHVVAVTVSCWHSHGFSTFCQAASKSKGGKFFSFSGEGWKNSASYGWICLHFVYPKRKMGWFAPSGASEWRGCSTILKMLHEFWVENLICASCCNRVSPCFSILDQHVMVRQRASCHHEQRRAAHARAHGWGGTRRTSGRMGIAECNLLIF